MEKAPQHLEASFTYERIAASVANLDQMLRVALMLRSDSELRSSLAGKSASVAYAIPERRGWLTVGQDAVPSHGRTRTMRPSARSQSCSTILA